MNYSKAPIDLPFIVYTNSAHDFHVTARSADRPIPKAESFAASLAKRCDPWINGRFRALVGVAPSPDLTGSILAFRVFDAGEFLLRPHTIAIVAVEVNAEPGSEWQLSQLLAALTVPVPGETNYRLPSPTAICRASTDVEPYASLMAWESKHGSHVPTEPITFADPPAAKPDLTDLALQLRGGHTPRRLSFGALSCAVVMIAALILAGVWWFRPDPVHDRTPTPHGHLRNELLSVLADSEVEPVINATDDQVQRIVLSTALVLDERMRSLRSDLGDCAERKAYHCAGTIDHHRELWRVPIVSRPQGGGPISQTSIDGAITVHRQYQEATRKIELLGKLDPDGAEFSRNLTGLLKILAATSDPGLARHSNEP